jgi:hypothetical protein
MQNIEPFYSWENLYRACEDRRSPFYNAQYNLREYTHDIYGYYIHPLWDYIGSETLYVKVLWVDYKFEYAIIEMFGEWNDTLHNDIMHFKRNVIDKMLKQGIKKFILIGENIFIFHGSDDCYYEEWFEDVEEGWIVAVNFQEFVHTEWKRFHLDYYINYGGELDVVAWRTIPPVKLYEYIDHLITKRLN